MRTYLMLLSLLSIVAAVSPDGLAQKTCFSFTAGLKYVENILKEAARAHSDRYGLKLGEQFKFERQPKIVAMEALIGSGKLRYALSNQGTATEPKMKVEASVLSPSKEHQALEKEIAAELSSYFGAVSPLRLLLGLSRSINEYHALYSASTQVLLEDGNWVARFNCLEETVHSPVAEDEFRFAFGQNLLEFLHPTEFDLSMATLPRIVKGDSALEGVWDMIKSNGFGEVQGDFGFTSDPALLSQLNFDEIPRPGFKITPTSEQDPLKLKTLDAVEFTQNLFVFVKDAQSDITIIPIKGKANMKAAFRSGIQTAFGLSQELYSQLDSFEVEVGDCQLVPNPEKSLASDSEDDDDDDFEDEDEESSSGLKASNLANLICSFKGLANQKLKESVTLDFVKHRIDLAINRARVNDWYLFLEHEHSFRLLCAGIDIQQPLASLNSKSGLLEISTKLKEPVLGMKAYCDRPDQELLNLNPSKIWEHQPAELLREFERDKTPSYHFARPHFVDEWFENNHLHMRITSVVLQFIEQHFFYRDWCSENHPELVSSRCAFAYSFYKPHREFDRVQGENFIYFNFDEPEVSFSVNPTIEKASKAMLYLAIGLYIFKIKIPYFLCLIACFNLLLHLPAHFLPFQRFGVDYLAYVNQAGQFWSGQTDYTKISSVQGECYYPAGHLWLYTPIYLLHRATGQAEHWVQALHSVLHTAAIVLVVKLAKMFFDPKKAGRMSQLVGLLLFTNYRCRLFTQQMFNDSFLGIALLLAIYFAAKDRAFLVLLFFSVGLSLKAGAILLLPAVLGWVQYRRGVLNLVFSLCFIVSFQLLLASPFIFDSVANLLGFPHGAQTPMMTYLERSRFLGSSEVGAHFDNTIYWKFLNRTFYEGADFMQFCKGGLLLGNLLFFLLRSGMFSQSLKNFWQLPQPGKVTFAERRKVIKFMAYLLIFGANFLPGGHQQFQLWYWELIPLALIGTGIPPLLVFKLFFDLYPANIWDPNPHHATALGLTLF